MDFSYFFMTPNENWLLREKKKSTVDNYRVTPKKSFKLMINENSEGLKASLDGFLIWDFFEEIFYDLCKLEKELQGNYAGFWWFGHKFTKGMFTKNVFLGEEGVRLLHTNAAKRLLWTTSKGLP
jgi:hypothetical protein